MHKELGRAITYRQLEKLSTTDIVTIITQSRAHFLAIESAIVFKMPLKIFANIFVDWAICKIESKKNTDEQTLANTIITMFDNLKIDKKIKLPTLALTSIADEAAKKNMNTQAKKLLTQEKSITRKIPILVSMNEYTTSLQEALDDHDSNMVYLVFQKFFGPNSYEAERIDLYRYIIDYPNKAQEIHFQNFVKMKDDQKIQNEFIEECKNLNHTLDYWLSICCPPTLSTVEKAKASLVKKVEAFKGATEYFKGTKDKGLSDYMSRQVKFTKDRIQGLETKQEKQPGSKKEVWNEANIVSYIERHLIKGRDDFDKRAADLAEEHQISMAKFAYMRTRALIKLQSWEKLIKYIHTHNTKSETVISYDYLFDLLDREGNQNISMKIAEKAPFDKRFDYYIKCDEQIKCADLCVELRKFDNLDKLQDIAINKKNREAVEYINEQNKKI